MEFRRTSCLSAVAVTAGLAVAALAPAAATAGPPPGEWTFVREDAFRHYACKQPTAGGPRWTVKTAGWLNNETVALEGNRIGVSAQIARGSNKRIVRHRFSDDWQNEYIRFTMRGVRSTDRVWLQGAYYGPTYPWADGTPVSRLKRCDRD